MEVVCHGCNKVLTRPDKIGIRDECEFCHADLHACKSCGFYDPKVYNECRETSADVVREKERANFCDFYQPRTDVAADKKAAALKAAAEALFKKK